MSFQIRIPGLRPRTPESTKLHVRAIPPILAGIRADKSNRLTFPCDCTVVLRGGLSPSFHDDACFTVAGAAHVVPMRMSSASCFPFNCRHEDVREHQNVRIVCRVPACDNRVS